MSKSGSAAAASSPSSSASWFASPWLYIGGAVALGATVGLTVLLYNSDKKEAARETESRHILSEVEHTFDKSKAEILDHIAVSCKSWNRFDRDTLAAIYTHFALLLDKKKPNVGILSHAAFEQLMRKLGVDDDAVLASLYRVFDKNGDGHIDFVELVKNLNELVHGTTQARLRRYFRIFDLDANGSITSVELHKLFHTFLKGVSDEQLDAWVTGAMAVMDANHDRRITFVEFERYCCTDPLRASAGTPGGHAGGNATGSEALTFSQKLQGGFERQLLAAFGVANKK